MMELYPQIRFAHILLVSLSGAFFALRGGAALAGQAWPRHAAFRYGSYTLDTLLLTSAAMLATILPHGYFANGWLTAKLALVVVYVVLGILAMRRARTLPARIACYAAALLVFACIVGMARMHSPWSWLAYLVH